jgi:hypothetical protein
MGILTPQLVQEGPLKSSRGLKSGVMIYCSYSNILMIQVVPILVPSRKLKNII